MKTSIHSVFSVWRLKAQEPEASYDVTQVAFAFMLQLWLAEKGKPKQ